LTRWIRRVRCLRVRELRFLFPPCDEE
jgi:hypothetical protein